MKKYQVVLIMNICNIDNVNLTQLVLKEPVRIQGGAFFSQISYNNGDLYVNTPKSKTKNGIVQTGKRMYTDLLYDESSDEMANWILDLEKQIKQKLFEKSSLWFHNDMDLDDIDYFFNSPLRTYKGNKYLLRCNVVSGKNPSSSIQIYDEDENLKDISEVEGKTLLSIIQIKGIRFTNNSFHLEIVLKQSMILNEKPLFSGCLIKPRKQNTEDLIEEHGTGSVESLLVQPKEEDNLEEISSITSSVILDETENVDDSLEENKNVIVNTDTDLEENLETLETSESPKILDNDTKNNTKEETSYDDDLEKPKTFSDLGNIEPIVVDTNDNLEEFSINFDELKNDEPITLKKPNEVYYEIYREARRKAKVAKKAAVIAYLEAKNIKNTYMLEEIDDSSDEEFDMDDYDLEQ